jgi:hypothetical protein
LSFPTIFSQRGIPNRPKELECVSGRYFVSSFGNAICGEPSFEHGTGCDDRVSRRIAGPPNITWILNNWKWLRMFR